MSFTFLLSHIMLKCSSHSFLITATLYCFSIKFLCCEANVIDICDDSATRIYASVGTSHIMSTETERTNLIKGKPNISTCNLQLISCSACVIVVKIWAFGSEKERILNTTDHSISDRNRSECLCDHVEITEPLHKVYSRKTSCIEYCDKMVLNSSFPAFTYRSQSRGLNILFQYSRKHNHTFTIEYTAKYNIHHIDLTPDPAEPSSFSGYLSTPFFPLQYPNDLRSQYNLKCKPRVPAFCRIYLIFVDHQLAPTTVLEFFENKKRRIGITTGRIFRPPVIISDGPSLSLNFYANRASSYGFRAKFIAVLDNDLNPHAKLETTCGGYITDNGGAITMINMVNREENTRTFDCIWIIKPVQKLDDLKTHLYMKVSQFDKIDGGAELVIHKGPTSQHKLLRQFYCNMTASTYSEEFVVHANVGFYMHMKGTFNHESRLIISYSTFSYSHSHELGIVSSLEPTIHDCYQSSEFLCRNYRCIQNSLHCDGLDHCGDYSDELSCNHDENITKNWRFNSQNYYFPNMDSHPGIPTGFIVACCASFVTFFLCSLICTVVYKIKYQAEITSRSNSSSHRRNGDQRSHERFVVEDGIPEEPPPLYDFPPSYHDAIIYNTMKKVIYESKKGVNSSKVRTIMLNCNHFVGAGCSGSSHLISKGSFIFPCLSSSEEDVSRNDNRISSEHCSVRDTELSPLNQLVEHVESTEYFELICPKLASTSRASKSTNNLPSKYFCLSSSESSAPVRMTKSSSTLSTHLIDRITET